MNDLNYITFFENITKDTDLIEYKKVFDEDATFKDPFHNVLGVEKIYTVFQDMYRKLDNPLFKINEVIQQNNIVYIKWDFEFQFKNDATVQSFEGVSRVVLNNEGKAISHVDYWDSAENLYEKIPIVSFFIKFLKNRIKS
jgi:hypothetical protein